MPLNKKIVRFASVFFVLPLIFLYANSSWATASLSASPSTTSYTGSYTISWTGNDGGAGGSLYENDVAISSIGSSNSGSYAVSGRGAGYFNYYIVYYNRGSPNSPPTKSPSINVYVIKAPPAPSTVNVIQNLASIAVFSYSANQANNYNYKRIGGIAYSGNTNKVNFTDTTIAFDTSYYYSVQACNEAGCSGWTNSASISIPPVPTAPVTVTATASGRNIILSNYGSPRATSYSITRTPSFASSPAIVSSSSYTDTSAVLGTTYAYQVSASNNTGISAAISSNSVRLPPVPSPPLAIWGSPAGSSVLVGWNSSPEASSYTLINSIGLNTTIVGVNNTSYSDYAISPGQQIIYQISACNSSGCSGFSSSATVQVPVQFYVTNNDNDGSFTLNWSGVATQARIFQSMPGGSDTLVTYGTTSGTYQVTGKTGGSTSNYYLENWYHPPAVGDFVNYGTTNLAVTVVKLPTPSYITASLNANTGNGPSMSVSWGSSPGTNVIYNLTRNNLPFTVAAGNLDASLAPNTNYIYSVFACRGTNCSSSIASSTVYVPPVPSVPSSITVSQSLKTVDVKWGASSNATTYEVTRNSVVISNANVTALNDAGVSIAVPTIYAVRGCNVAWCSNQINSASITLPPVPATPASIFARVNLSSITINGSPTTYATKYYWRRNGVGMSSSGDGSNSAYGDLNVANGTQYTYSVQACNATGCSDWIIASPVVGGAITPGVPVNMNYEYDALGRLNKVNRAGALKTEYKYDNAGNRKEVIEN